MQVKGRIFPYPVLNNNPVFSGFKSESFSLNYEAVEDESNYTLKGLTFATESKAINSLFKEGKIGICLIVECSDTVYRKKFDLTEKPKDIVLKKVDFVEKVCISLFAYAKEDFKLVSEEFDDDYKGIDFQIEKYDIVAANRILNGLFALQKQIKLEPVLKVRKENTLKQMIFRDVPGVFMI